MIPPLRAMCLTWAMEAIVSIEEEGGGGWWSEADAWFQLRCFGPSCKSCSAVNDD